MSLVSTIFAYIEKAAQSFFCYISGLCLCEGYISGLCFCEEQKQTNYSKVANQMLKKAKLLRPAPPGSKQLAVLER